MSPKVRPLSVGGVGNTVAGSTAPDLLEHPGRENEVSWRPPPADFKGLGSRRTGKALDWSLYNSFLVLPTLPKGETEAGAWGCDWEPRNPTSP